MLTTIPLLRTEKQNPDSQAHHPVAAITAVHLEVAAAGTLVVALGTVVLLWAAEVEVASSTSLTFVAPSSALIFSTATGVLTYYTIASLQCRLARHERLVPTSRYDTTKLNFTARVTDIKPSKRRHRHQS
jgi:hypothetical protein